MKRKKETKARADQRATVHCTVCSGSRTLYLQFGLGQAGTFKCSVTFPVCKTRRDKHKRKERRESREKEDESEKVNIVKREKNRRHRKEDKRPNGARLRPWELPKVKKYMYYLVSLRLQAIVPRQQKERDVERERDQESEKERERNRIKANNQHATFELELSQVHGHQGALVT